jgi:hypothetical protein
MWVVAPTQPQLDVLPLTTFDATRSTVFPHSQINRQIAFDPAATPTLEVAVNFPKTRP